MSDFQKFSQAVNNQYNLLAQGDLWYSSITKKQIREAYLA